MSLPSGPLDGLLCAFSSSSSKFALATPDGRVRTYDTGELQQCRQRHTCCCYGCNSGMLCKSACSSQTSFYVLVLSCGTWSMACSRLLCAVNTCLTAAAAMCHCCYCCHPAVSGRLRSTLSVGVNASKHSGSANGHLAEGQQCLTWVDSEVCAHTLLFPMLSPPVASACATGFSAVTITFLIDEFHVPLHYSAHMQAKMLCAVQSAG
jgi:hypothetical protein